MSIVFFDQDEVALSSFLSSCEDELKTFRYFNNRPLSVCNKHCLSKIISIDDVPAAYFHLEKENEKYWFGICVKKRYQGIGISTLILNYVKVFCIVNNIDRIHLTVDNHNFIAINAYLKQGFSVFKNNLNNIEMHLMVRRSSHV